MAVVHILIGGTGIVAAAVCASPLAYVGVDDLGARWRFTTVGADQQLEPGSIVALNRDGTALELLCSPASPPLFTVKSLPKAELYNWLGDVLPDLIVKLGSFFNQQSTDELLTHATDRKESSKYNILTVQGVQSSYISDEMVRVIRDESMKKMACSQSVSAHLEAGFLVCSINNVYFESKSKVVLGYRTADLCMVSEGRKEPVFAPPHSRPFWASVRETLKVVNVTFDPPGVSESQASVDAIGVHPGIKGPDAIATSPP